MLNLRTIIRRPVAAVAAAGSAGACLYGYYHAFSRPPTALCEAHIIAPAGLKNVAERLGSYVKDMDNNDKIISCSTNDDMKICGVKDEHGHKQAGGLPVVRAAQAIIKAPIDEVALCWWQAGRRKEWDSVNTQDSQLVQSLDDRTRLVYLQGKAKKGGIISSRDFCYTMYRASPDLLEAKPGSALFVQVNNPKGVPPNKASTRGDVNSLLLLEPIDSTTTKASYAIEIDVKGWLPLKVVKSAADETALTIVVMRDHLEKELKEEQALPPAAAAKHALSRRASYLEDTHTHMVGAWATKDDLLSSRKLLLAQLKTLDVDERKTGLDFSEYRSKLEQQLADIEKRL